MRILLYMLLFCINLTRGQLSCDRISVSFCCTTRIREQCPAQCANVNCDDGFIHSLFSIDSPRGQAKDGSAQISHTDVIGSKFSEIETDFVTKPDEPAPTREIFTTPFPTLIPITQLPSSTIRFTPREARRRTTPDPRIIRPPESLVVIGDYDEDEPPTENAVVFVDTLTSTTTILPPPSSTAIINNPEDVSSLRSRKEISDGTASRRGSSAEWKVSIIPRQQKTRKPDVNAIPALTIDGKSDERFNKFYRNFGQVFDKITKPDTIPSIPTSGSIESSASVVALPRTTVPPGTTNRVQVSNSALTTRGPPSVAPAQSHVHKQCGVAPDFTPCVSNEIASRELLACCQRKNLPAGCQALCRYDITQAEIRLAMDRGQCGIFNVAPFLECASQGKDNTECCRQRGIVQKTGPQCEQFCRPTQGLTALGIQHIVCGGAVGDMLHCHHSGVRI